MMKLEARNLNLWYGNTQVLKGIHFSVPGNSITAVIGPSGCGKTSLLRVFNRMNDLIPEFRGDGDVLIDGESVSQRGADLIRLRRRVGFVFPRPNPFPLSIFDNVAYGPRIHGRGRSAELIACVQSSLEQVGLWQSLKDKLDTAATNLSAEHQQRLCIARLLAVEPEVLLLDEPCLCLDWLGTARLEELLRALKTKYTIVMATHNVQQAGRVSDWTAYLSAGEIVEYGETQMLFTRSADQRTENYISGRFV